MRTRPLGHHRFAFFPSIIWWKISTFNFSKIVKKKTSLRGLMSHQQRVDQIRLKINSKLTRPRARGCRAGTAIIKASAQAAELIHQSASASITQLQLLQLPDTGCSTALPTWFFPPGETGLSRATTLEENPRKFRIHWILRFRWRFSSILVVHVGQLGHTRTKPFLLTVLLFIAIVSWPSERKPTVCCAATHFVSKLWKG